jgi:RNA polymerase sigma factor (TIGR02999 family)
MSGVTQILASIERGDPHAADRLLPLVYDELRQLASQKLANEKPGQTLQATALVHEAYLRLVGPNQPPWAGRGHFVAAAAEAMRRILVDQARRKGRLKHGGDLDRVDLDRVELSYVAAPDLLLSVHEALDRFAGEEPDAAELVKLRFFVGLSIEEAADSLGMSRSTAYEHWSYARAWLHNALYGRAAAVDR